MREIHIVFTKSKKRFPIFSWLIRLWTWKPYSHVARCLEVRDWGKTYYQASEGSVNYEYHTIFNKKHKIVKEYIISVPAELEREIRKVCFKEAGSRYGILQNVGILLVDVCKVLGIEIDNPWEEGRNCSELLYVKVLKKLHPELDYNKDKIKPHHIEKILIDKYGK